VLTSTPRAIPSSSPLRTQKKITGTDFAQVPVRERYDEARKMLLTEHARGPVPNLEQDEEDERYEKGDKGGGVDGDDVLAVLLSFRRSTRCNVSFMFVRDLWVRYLQGKRTCRTKIESIEFLISRRPSTQPHSCHVAGRASQKRLTLDKQPPPTQIQCPCCSRVR
jgi:hypothetical protein